MLYITPYQTGQKTSKFFVSVETIAKNYNPSGEMPEKDGYTENSRVLQVFKGDDGSVSIIADQPTNGRVLISSSAIFNETGYDLNLENGIGSGAVQQKEFVFDGESQIKPSGLKGTQSGDTVPGAVATGENAIALGGLRYDAYTNPDTFAYNKTIDENAEENFGEAPTSADGNQSFAVGGSVHARADWTVAMGKDSESIQRGAIALGGGTVAGRTEEEWNELPADRKFADTYEKDFSFAVAMGEQAKAKGRSAMAVNNRTSADGDYSFAGNHNTKASARNSVAFGNSTVADAENQMAIGTYNEKDTAASFIVGNGTSNSNRRNAFKVMFDGRAKVLTAPREPNDVVRKEELDEKADVYYATSSIAVGSDLSGKTLKFDTTVNYYAVTGMDKKCIISSGGYIIGSGYPDLILAKADTSDSAWYEKVVVIFASILSGIEWYYSEYTLPDDFGTVIKIETAYSAFVSLDSVKVDCEYNYNAIQGHETRIKSLEGKPSGISGYKWSTTFDESAIACYIRRNDVMYGYSNLIPITKNEDGTSEIDTQIILSTEDTVIHLWYYALLYSDKNIYEETQTSSYIKRKSDNTAEFQNDSYPVSFKDKLVFLVKDE